MSDDQERVANPIFETFMSRRSVILSDEISDESVSEVGQRLIELQAHSPDRINLIIDSGGGNMDAALRLCDLMSIVMTAPVRGIALGTCGSAATFIMLYCNERVGTRYSRFLIHSGTRDEISIPIGQTTSAKLEQLLRETKTTEEMVLDLYTSRLTPTAWAKKKPTNEKRREYVRRLIDRGDQAFDEWMSAEEAVEVGLITEIVRGKLDIFRD